MPKKHQSLKITADNRPSDRDYAMLSNHVYEADELTELGSTLKESSDWKVLQIQSDDLFFGVIYRHEKTNHIVVAYRGTQKNIQDLMENLRGIFTIQALEAAIELTEKAIALANKDKSNLSFTGHSLGAYLAELQVYYCYYYRVHYSKKKKQGASVTPSATTTEDGDSDVNIENKLNEADLEFVVPESVHAVTFESPGTLDVMKELESQFNSRQVDLMYLDITTYLSYPNLVNTCNPHVGTMYSFATEISSWQNVCGEDSKQVYTMTKIVELFNKAENRNYCPERYFILDWPQGNQREYYFENVRLEGNEYVWTRSVEELAKWFEFQTQGQFRVDQGLGNWKILPLRHFEWPMREWLNRFYETMIQGSQSDVFLERLKAKIQALKIPSHVIGYLSCCVLEKKEGIVYLLTKSENTEQTGVFIRRELSRWLSENSNQVDILLTTIQDIQMEIVGPGNRSSSSLTRATSSVIWKRVDEATTDDDSRIKRAIASLKGNDSYLLENNSAYLDNSDMESKGIENLLQELEAIEDISANSDLKNPDVCDEDAFNEFLDLLDKPHTLEDIIEDMKNLDKETEGLRLLNVKLNEILSQVDSANTKHDIAVLFNNFERELAKNLLPEKQIEHDSEDSKDQDFKSFNM